MRKNQVFHPSSVLLRLIVIVLISICYWPAISFSETLWDVEKLVAYSKVFDVSKPLELRDDDSVGYVRVDHLRTLLEAYRRIGDVSKVNAHLTIVVEKKPNATAYFGEKLIVVTTGMLDIIGGDPDMVAALLGHEFAHLSLRHAVQRVLNLPNLMYSGLGAANRVSQQTGSAEKAARVGSIAIALLAASFNREQETEADKVGTEFQAKAKYDPNGTLRLFNTFLKTTGAKATSYFDTHPGMEERFKNAVPTVVDQQIDVIAATLVEKKHWKALAGLADEWIKTNPNSAYAWYYKGIALNGLRRSGSLIAFQKAVTYDRSFVAGWLELCVELYRVGRERDSLICSERLSLNDVKEAYEERTFQHSVFVGGMEGAVGLGELEARIINEAMTPQGQVGGQTAQERREIAERDAKDFSALSALRNRCESLTRQVQQMTQSRPTTGAEAIAALSTMPIVIQAMNEKRQACDEFDRKLAERQIYEVTFRNAQQRR